MCKQNMLLQLEGKTSLLYESIKTGRKLNIIYEEMLGETWSAKLLGKGSQ